MSLFFSISIPVGTKEVFLCGGWGWGVGVGCVCVCVCFVLFCFVLICVCFCFVLFFVRGNFQWKMWVEFWRFVCLLERKSEYNDCLWLFIKQNTCIYSSLAYLINFCVKFLLFISFFFFNFIILQPLVSTRTRGVPSSVVRRANAARGRLRRPRTFSKERILQWNSP